MLSRLGQRRHAPLEKLLDPVHPQVVIHPAVQQELFLRRVPGLVIGFTADIDTLRIGKARQNLHAARVGGDGGLEINLFDVEKWVQENLLRKRCHRPAAADTLSYVQ